MSKIANPAEARAHNPRRAYWLKTLHQWHWISSGLCLLGMLLFAATGVTLNHASQIEAKPSVSSRKGQLPAPLRQRLSVMHVGGNNDEASDPLPAEVRDWLDASLQVAVGARAAEWSPEEIYVALPRPGGDAWLRIDRASGDIEYERTDRGWISYLNDLHKGRNTGAAWSWFIDLFAMSCLIFSITGLFILKMHAANRPTTWPVVGLGALIPFLLAILFIH